MMNTYKVKHLHNNDWVVSDKNVSARVAAKEFARDNFWDDKNNHVEYQIEVLELETMILKRFEIYLNINIDTTEVRL